MRKRVGLFLIVASSMLVSCGDNQQKSLRNVAVNDSLLAESELQRDEVNEVVDIINDVSMSLDSIQLQENMIYKLSKDGSNRDKILAQIRSFRKLLGRKQNKINQLMKNNKEMSSSKKATIRNLQKMVGYLQKQLQEKNQQVAQLEEIVRDKDVSIDKLRYNVNRLGAESYYLKEQNYQQDRAQNTIYYLVASEKELKKSGVLKGGFLKKKKINSETIDKKLFSTRDLRVFKTLVIPSKAPKILTNNPASCYTLTNNSDGTTTLNITNPEKFWNFSHFLIIQQ